MSENQPSDPREIIAGAFAAQIAAGLGLVSIDRNAPEADLATNAVQYVLIDGPEAKPKTDIRGYIVNELTLELEINVRVEGVDPVPVLNAALARARAAALSDRTLGGLLVGEMCGPYERLHFDGMELGELRTEIIRIRGAERGAGCNQDFILKYATPPDDPTRLVTRAEWD